MLEILSVLLFVVVCIHGLKWFYDLKKEFQNEEGFVALIMCLVVVNALARLIPLPMGANASFVIPMVCGFYVSKKLGFVVGVLSMLLSSLQSGGVGPWLPYQMVLLGGSSVFLGLGKKINDSKITFIGFCFVWGLVFGILMNVLYWPMMNIDPVSSVWEKTKAFFSYSLISSFGWDVTRAVGNSVLGWTVAPHLVRLIEKFKRRFSFERL